MLIPLCDEIRRIRLPAITFLLVVMHLALFVSALDGQWTQTGGRLHEICFNSGVSYDSMQHQQWLNYATYWMLDKSWFALMVNLIVLLIFGPSLEDRAGRLLFLVIYSASAVVGGIFHSWFPTHIYPTVTTSGAIAGLLGAYAIQIDLQTKIRTLSMYYEQSLSGITLCFGWIVAQVFLANYDVCDSAVASFTIILGGFLTGVILGFLTKEFTPNVVMSKAGSLEIVPRSEANLYENGRRHAATKGDTDAGRNPGQVCPYCHNENHTPLIDNDGSFYYRCEAADCHRLVFVSRKAASRLVQQLPGGGLRNPV